MAQSLLEARSKLARTWRWCEAAQAVVQSPQETHAEWQRAEGEFRQQIAGINAKIRAYNLEVPLNAFQVAILDPEMEIQRIIRDENPATR